MRANEVEWGGVVCLWYVRHFFVSKSSLIPTCGSVFEPPQKKPFLPPFAWWDARDLLERENCFDREKVQTVYD